MVDVTDDFNRANGALGSNWVAGPSFSAPTIVSSQAAGGGASAWWIAYWNPTSNTFSNDQHAQISPVSGLYGVIVRHQASTSSGYLYFKNVAQDLLYRIDSGSFNLLTSTTTAAATTSVRLDATGTTLTCSADGTTTITFTEGTYTSGQPGMALNDTAVLDNFLGGPATGLGAPTPVGIGTGAGMIQSITMVAT
jgi:hypothetical protein